MNNFYTANIEMLYYSHGDYSNIDDYASQLLQEAKINKNSINVYDSSFVLFTTLLWEPHLLDNAKPYIELFKSFKRKNIKTVLLLDSYFKSSEHLKLLETEIYFVDFFLWRTYDKVVNQKKSQVNLFWNQNADKFLFLNGKPDRPNRIRLLWKLRDLLNRSIWSLHVHDGTRMSCRQLIPEISDKEFNEFVEMYNQNPDDANVIFQDFSCHYGGIPYKVDLFRDTLFRIVSETNLNEKDPPWLTEKTWITILNRLPFIMAGDLNSLKKLNDLGFRTFEKYLPVQNYDQIANYEEKLNAIVKNARYWLYDMHEKQEIASDVDHNYELLIGMAKKNEARLREVCAKFGINERRVGEICNTFDILGNE